MIRTTALLTAVALLGAAGTVRANGTLQPELAAVAKDLKKFLDGRGEGSLAVGQFAGPPATSAGPGVAKVLAEELEKLGVKVAAGAKWGVKGEYAFAEEEDPETRDKLLVARIRVVVVDKLGNVLVDIPFERTAVVRGEADVIHLAGVPVALPADARTRPERDKKIKAAIVDPKTEVRGEGKTRIAVGDKYAVEILVNEKARAVEVQEGLAFVPLPQKTEYTVRLINDSDLEAAVRLTIDGLSVFAFSEYRHKSGPKAGEPLYNVFLVGPKAHLDVPGWHVNNERSDQFVVAAFARSAAAELKSEAGIGTITASFSAAWTGDLPPADEPPKMKNSGVDATGRGRPVGTELKEVVRTVGAVRASVSVRYTSK